MKRSKFSKAQAAFILREAEEGTPIGEVCRKAGISEANFPVWRKDISAKMYLLVAPPDWGRWHVAPEDRPDPFRWFGSSLYYSNGSLPRYAD